MKLHLKTIVAAGLLTAVAGLAGAQTQSKTNLVTQGIFSNEVDNYGNVRNWSTVDVGNAFGAAEIDIYNLGLGAAGNAGALYLAGWYKGNILSRADTSGTAETERNSLNMLVGFGRNSIPMGVRLSMNMSGASVENGDYLAYTPGVSFGMRMAGLGGMDLFRLEAGVDAPIYGKKYAAADRPAYYDPNTVVTQIKPSLMAQMNWGRHGVTVAYKPVFEIGDYDSKKTAYSGHRYMWHSHDIKVGYLVSRNFEDKVWLGADVGANFVVTGTHEQTSASDKTDNVLLNIKPYLAGAFKWSPVSRLSINLGAKFVPNFEQRMVTTKTAAGTDKNKSWSWKPDASFGAGFGVKMLDNIWLDTAVWTAARADTSATDPVGFGSQTGVILLDNFVSKLSVQLAVRF